MQLAKSKAKVLLMWSLSPYFCQVYWFSSAKTGKTRAFGILAVDIFEMGLQGDTELQIRGSYEDNSKIIFLIFQQKHML